MEETEKIDLVSELPVSRANEAKEQKDDETEYFSQEKPGYERAGNHMDS